VLKFDSSNSECSIFTFKDGLLSAAAHDLKIRVSKFEIETQWIQLGDDLSEWDISIKAVFDAGSLKTVCAMSNGKEAFGALKASDRDDIEKNISSSVLKSEQYPKVRFSSSTVSGNVDALRIKGKLTLCGVTRTIVFPAVRQNRNYVAEMVLSQPDFGIKPFSALLGTMKIKPEIKVRMSIPLSLKTDKNI